MTDLSIPDGELVRRAQRGEREAFGLLVRRHQRLAHGLAYHRLRDFEDAQDAAQAGFVRAFVELPRLRDADAFGAWLRRIVENECQGTLRRRRPTAPLDERHAAPEADLAARLDLQRALEGLPEPDRLVLTLFLFEGNSLVDVAGFLGTTRDAVMSRLRHARARLRRAEMSMAENTIDKNRLPEDWAERIPIPYDEHDPRGLPEAAPEPLTAWRRTWLLSAYPEGTEVLRAEAVGHPWQGAVARPARVELRLPDGGLRSVELRASGRRGGADTEAALLSIVSAQGIPVPRLVLAPTPDPGLPGWGPLLAVEPLQAQTAIAWCLERGVDAVERACEVVLDAADGLKEATAAVEAAAVPIERASLADELRRIETDGGPWTEDARFREAIQALRPVVASIDVPLVLTDSGVGPNALVDEEGRFAGLADLSWARIEDPHHAVTKYWTYDCWPLRRAGFVERYLVRHGLTLRDLAPRLAVRALATLQREVPVRGGSAEYRETMLGWLAKGMADL